MLQHQNPFVLSYLALFLAFFCHCYATKFKVGDSSGWIVPPYPAYYSNWSDSHFIRVGDSVEFKFDDKFYNLIQVSKQEYEHCTSLEPIRIFNSSPVILPLREKGVMYFTCTILNYCCIGQKIVISIHDRSPELPPSLSPSPSPSQGPITMPPQLSPNGSSGISSPPSPTTSTISENAPVPSSTQEGKSNAVALLSGRHFNVSLGLLLSLLGTLLGFWVM